MTIKKWFQPGKKTNWDKSDLASVRRDKTLRSRHGNALKAGRALQALANVTKDKQTKELAALDARFFFRQNAQQQKTR